MQPMISDHTAPRLILASGSTYRRLLLARLQLSFEVVAPDIDEKQLIAEAPQATAIRLAQEKAAAVAADFPNALVIGSDQVATLDGQQIGKPGTHAKALAQLQTMRGRRVLFHTALCLHDTRPAAAQTIQTTSIATTVTFRNLSDASLDAYLRIEQPYDCAGSAKNEGLGIALIASCESADPTALTGLPMIALCGMLMVAGVQFFTGTQVAAPFASTRS